MPELIFSRDANIPVKGTITVTGPRADVATGLGDEINEQMISQNCALVTDCICEINITEVIILNILTQRC